MASVSEQNGGPWVDAMIQERTAATGLSRELLLERAERRFQGVYTVCLAVISGIGYTLVYRLLYRRSLPGWNGAFVLSLNYLAFLFIVFLPLMLLVAVLRARFGSAPAILILLVSLGIAAWWNIAARAASAPFAGRQRLPKVLRWSWPGW